MPFSFKENTLKFGCLKRSTIMYSAPLINVILLHDSLEFHNI